MILERLLMSHREIKFEGLSEEEILALPRETIKDLVLIDEPLVFRGGVQQRSWGVSSRRKADW